MLFFLKLEIELENGYFANEKQNKLYQQFQFHRIHYVFLVVFSFILISSEKNK